MDLEKLRQMKAKKKNSGAVAPKGSPALSATGQQSTSFADMSQSIQGGTGRNDANAAPVTVINLGKKHVPKVQELGGRKSSSRLMVGGRKERDRARSKSSASNISGTFAVSSGMSDYKASSETIIRYGELLKKGVVNASWKKRFFVLTDKHLYYYDDVFDVPQEFTQIDIAPKGQIDLSFIDDIKKEKNDQTGATFNIFTPTRTYRLRLEPPPLTQMQAEMNVNLGRIGADAWVAAIAGACENAKQHAGYGGPVHKGSFGSFKVDEVDNANMNSSTFMHPTKRLIDSERFKTKGKSKKGTGGPHKPAAIDEYAEWTPFDVSAWLYTVQMHQYAETFYKQGIDGKALKELTKKEDALNAGVKEEDVMEFLRGVEELIAINLSMDMSDSM